MNKVGEGGRLFAKIVFHDGVHQPIYGLYARNFCHPVTGSILVTEMYMSTGMICQRKNLNMMLT